MAAAALARVLRGGRRSGAFSHLPSLMTGIGRRAPLERAAGPLLPRLGVAGDAGGIGRRLLSDEVSPASQLDKLKKEYMRIPGPGRFVPYDSEFVILDLATRLEDIVLRMERYNRFFRCVAVLAAVVLVMIGGATAYLYHQHQTNQKCLDEIRTNLRQAEAGIEEVEALVREIDEQLP